MISDTVKVQWELLIVISLIYNIKIIVTKTQVNIVTEEINSYLSEELIYEMAMKPQRIKDKYGEVVGAIVDNLVCICLYPNNPATAHWRERAYGLCKRFVDIDIDPINRNNPKYRLKYLNDAVTEILNKDYSAILNHFKTVAAYYANRPNIHERLTPHKPYQECYKENKERVKNGIIALTKYTANQDYEGMINYMNNF